MGEPITTGLLIASIAGTAASGVSNYMQSQAQKRAAQKAEEAARAQAQLNLEQAPEQATNTSSSSVVQKDEGIKGFRANMLANSKKQISPQAGDKTLLGQ